MERYKQAMDTVRAGAAFKARMQDMLADMNAAPVHDRKRRARRLAGWLIPAAAMLVLALTLLSIPRVSQAIRDWLYDAFRVDRYLYVPAQERTHDPDLDGAIVPRDELEQSNEILLLSETEDYERLDAMRLEKGYPAYDPEEWAWLAAIRPEIADLYYDGVDFMVMTFFPCDPLPFMSGFIDDSISPMRLDILTFDIGTITNLETGEAQELYAISHGLTPQPDYWHADGSANTAAIAEDGGVWLYDEYALPHQAQLAPGRYRVKITHCILDDHVGEMSANGTIAVCRQSFVLDTSKALAAIEEEALAPVSFSGTYESYAVLKVDDSGTQYAPVTVDLNGLTVTPRLQKRPTGLRVTLDYAAPVGSEGDVPGFETEGGYGLVYELFVDGVSMGTPFIESDGTHIWIDIAMTASERRDCASLVLKPRFMNWKAFILDGVEYPLAEGHPIPASGFEPVSEMTEIAGADIVIPTLP